MKDTDLEMQVQNVIEGGQGSINAQEEIWKNTEQNLMNN